MHADHPPPLPGARPVQQENKLLRKVVPYKNPFALFAYYLAVFSLIPILGLPLGLIAFILGIVGLIYASTHEETHGRAHAIVGIILGGFCAALWTWLILVLIGSAHSPYAAYLGIGE